MCPGSNLLVSHNPVSHPPFRLPQTTTTTTTSHDFNSSLSSTRIPSNPIWDTCACPGSWYIRDDHSLTLPFAYPHHLCLRRPSGITLVVFRHRCQTKSDSARTLVVYPLISQEAPVPRRANETSANANPYRTPHTPSQPAAARAPRRRQNRSSSVRSRQLPTPTPPPASYTLLFLLPPGPDAFFLFSPP